MKDDSGNSGDISEQGIVKTLTGLHRVIAMHLFDDDGETPIATKACRTNGCGEHLGHSSVTTQALRRGHRLFRKPGLASLGADVAASEIKDVAGPVRAITAENSGWVPKVKSWMSVRLRKTEYRHAPNSTA